MVHLISDGESKPHSDELADIKDRLDAIADAIALLGDQIAQMKPVQKTEEPELPEKFPDTAGSLPEPTGDE